MSFESQVTINSALLVPSSGPISNSDHSFQANLGIKPATTEETLQGHYSGNQNVDVEKNEQDKKIKEYKSLVKRFNFKVVLSTFACSLVVAYITFVNNVAHTMSRMNYGQGIPYNVFILLAYLSISLHALSSIVSSRGAVLCSDPDLIKEQKYKVEDFKDILALCQHLNLHGMILFAFAVLGSSFFVFESYAYSGVFCGFSLVVVVLIFVGKYRKLSLIYRDLTQVWSGIKALWNTGK